MKYGISKVVYGEDNIDSATCMLGDGMTRIASVGFDAGHVGLCLLEVATLTVSHLKC